MAYSKCNGYNVYNDVNNSCRNDAELENTYTSTCRGVEEMRWEEGPELLSVF